MYRTLENSFLSDRSPYKRETYRYTPLLALLLAPNVWLHPSFGKYLFAACDLVNGLLIYRLLVSNILPSTTQAKPTNTTRPPDDQPKHPDRKAQTSVGSSIPIENASEGDTNTVDSSSIATLYTALHLLNPLVFTISTRGSSESVLALFVMLTLYGAFNGWWGFSAVMLGLSTHWKIYPVVYGVACLGIVGAGDSKEKRSLFRILVNTRTISFTIISAGTFGLLGLACYLV